MISAPKNWVITIWKLTDTGELATLLEVKTFGEEDGVAESSLLRRCKVNIVGAGGVEGETALGIVTEGVGALGIVRFHGLLAIRGISVGMRKSLKDVFGSEGRVCQGKGTIGRAGGPGVDEVGNREELVKQSTEDTRPRTRGRGGRLGRGRGIVGRRLGRSRGIGGVRVRVRVRAAGLGSLLGALVILVLGRGCM